MSQVTSQAVVVPQAALKDGLPPKRMALFNEDGTPFSGGGGGSTMASLSDMVADATSGSLTGFSTVVAISGSYFLQGMLAFAPATTPAELTATFPAWYFAEKMSNPSPWNSREFSGACSVEYFDTSSKVVYIAGRFRIEENKNESEDKLTIAFPEITNQNASTRSMRVYF